MKGRGAQISVHNQFRASKYEVEHGLDDNNPQETEMKIQTRIIPVKAKTIINRVNSPDIPVQHSLNPYQGCEHGCVYCYARNSHEYWDGGAGLEFESMIMAKTNAPELLKQFLAHPRWEAGPIMLAGNTDIYQPAERELKITRSLLEIFSNYRHPVELITKNALILRDIDLLRSLAQDDLVHVNISLTTTDQKLKSVMEPRTSAVKSILEAIEKLSKENIPVNVMMAPVIPSLNDIHMPELARSASDAGALGFSYQVVRLNGQVETIFKDWIAKKFPDRAGRVISQIRQLHGGSVSDSRFGRRMRGEGPWAETIKTQYQILKKRFFAERGMPYLNLSLFQDFKPGQLRLF
jgi:DNA repair photolyase